MKEHVTRLVIDLIYTACYLFLAHTGYNITDQLQADKPNAIGYIVIWIMAAMIMFFLTKQRYDKEVEEGANDED
jgi:TRAP-type C4-dicarboxylate transport system permease small subunit